MLHPTITNGNTWNFVWPDGTKVEHLGNEYSMGLGLETTDEYV